MVDAASANDRYKNVSENKADGVTYTPRELADFVADRILDNLELTSSKPLKILDPALGHGELLLALLARLGPVVPVEVYGFETDKVALDEAKRRVTEAFPRVVVHFSHGSFLDHVLDDCSGGLFGTPTTYDLIIANPPYVRTQIMGADRAKQLANQFGLSGRVDLYHAFLLGMARVLSPHGAAGFIVSNRFMTTKGGAATRSAMVSELCLREVYDLGDTKVFDAAVLPAVLIATGNPAVDCEAEFTSIYECKEDKEFVATTPVQALKLEGVVEVEDGRRFQVHRGKLDNGGQPNGVWRLTSDAVEKWLKVVDEHTALAFRDIGKIRVGIKTCADKVFLPKTWEEDLELHKPLTTHHTARRFRPEPPNRKVLYPHVSVDGKKQAVDLSAYPKSQEYLNLHRGVLEGRKYVIEAGKNWYEIWVPQNPAEWPKAKLVFRDISARPTFWMDLDGTVVNGDCYWLTGEVDLLWLALGVANSTFIERYYDRRFNNKLYAGRRRFITQYVEQFPLPDPTSEISRQIITLCRDLYAQMETSENQDAERAIDVLVWQAFGLSVEEICR